MRYAAMAEGMEFYSSFKGFIPAGGAGYDKLPEPETLTRFSEEYQADVYKRTLPMLDKIPGFTGCTPWILCDFRSPRRLLPEIQDGWNLKGVIGHNGQKKMAFDVLKDFYDAKAKADMAK